MPKLMTVPRSHLIEPPEPIRVAMDTDRLESLAASIRRHGVVLPLVVTEVFFDVDHERSRKLQIAERKQGLQAVGYEIIDGHRRYIASGIVGLAELPVNVFANVADVKFGIMLDANIEREDITAAEEGLQFLEVADKRGWGIEQIMQHFGKGEQYVNERVRLVQEYPDVVKPVSERRINWSQAKAIMRCSDPAHRAYLIDQADTHGASTRTLTYLVDQWKTSINLSQGKPAVSTPIHGIPVAVASNQKCLWCTRDDDPSNIVQIPVHSYHRRDLEEFLERVGLNRPGHATAG